MGGETVDFVHTTTPEDKLAEPKFEMYPANMTKKKLEFPANLLETRLVLSQPGVSTEVAAKHNLTVDNQRKDFRMVMASYHETANRIAGMGRTMETLSTKTSFQQNQIDTLTATITQQKQTIKNLELDTLHEKTKRAVVENERDCALSSLRQFKKCLSDSEQFNSVVPMTSLTIDLQRREMQIKELERQTSAKQEEMFTLSYSCKQLSSLVEDMKSSLEEANAHGEAVDALNNELVEKLSVKNMELTNALASVELLSTEYHTSLQQLSFTRVKEAAATQKLLDTEHAKMMQEAKSNLERAELKRDYEQQLARIKEINFELREDSIRLTELVEKESNGFSMPKQFKPDVPSLGPATASSRNSPGRSQVVGMDGKIAAGLVQWKTHWTHVVPEKQDTTLDQIADDLISSLCNKVQLLETELLAKPPTESPKKPRERSFFDIIMGRMTFPELNDEGNPHEHTHHHHTAKKIQTKSKPTSTATSPTTTPTKRHKMMKSKPKSPARPPSSSTSMPTSPSIIRTTSTSSTPSSTTMTSTSRTSPLKVTTSTPTQDRPTSEIGHTATTTQEITEPPPTVEPPTVGPQAGLRPPPTVGPPPIVGGGGSPQRPQTFGSTVSPSSPTTSDQLEGVNRTHFVAWKLSQHPQPEVNASSIDNSYEV